MSHRILTACAALALIVGVQKISSAQDASTTGTQDSTTGSALPADARVFGMVVDEPAGTPIQGAIVSLSDGRITETDADGKFSFPHVRPGTHQISAVTKGCAQAAGGFSVVSGRDKELRLVVEMPKAPERIKRGDGTATRVIDADQLAEIGNRSALDALMQYYASAFEVQGRALVLRTRQGVSSSRAIEPLLVVDGVHMRGMVAQALGDLRANDVERIQVHLGTAAGWIFQPGGAPAVIEVTSHRGRVARPGQPAESCQGWKDR